MLWGSASTILAFEFVSLVVKFRSLLPTGWSFASPLHFCPLLYFLFVYGAIEIRAKIVKFDETSHQSIFIILDLSLTPIAHTVIGAFRHGCSSH
jgi:hypothetical protein